MEFEKILITPKIAKQYLEANTGNRILKPYTVKKYCCDMKEGKWKEDTGECIKISKTGKVLDGQHRLEAIVLSGVSISLHVAIGVDDAVFNVIDTGTKRSPGDAFHIAGVKNAILTPSIINFYISLTNKASSKTNRANTTNQLLLDMYYEKEEYWDELATATMKNYKAFSQILSPSMVGGFNAFFDARNPNKSNDFMNQLCTGMNVTNNSIALLRQALISDKLAIRSMPSMVKKALIIKAWNYYNTNKEVKKLTFNFNNSKKEKFPVAFSL